MKTKIFTIILLIVTLTVASCKKDDVSPNYSSIIGSWNSISTTEGKYLSSKSELTWTFNRDNTGVTRAIISINNNVMSDVSSPFNYEYNGANILIRTKEQTFNYTVTVTGNKMKLGNDEKGYFDLTKK